MIAAKRAGDRAVNQQVCGSFIPRGSSKKILLVGVINNHLPLTALLITTEL